MDAISINYILSTRLSSIGISLPPLVARRLCKFLGAVWEVLEAEEATGIEGRGRDDTVRRCCLFTGFVVTGREETDAVCFD